MKNLLVLTNFTQMNELLHDPVAIDQMWTRGGVVFRFWSQMKHQSIQIQQLASGNCKPEE